MPQWVERVVQEDLNVGTGDVWLRAPGGGEILSTQIGLHSVARGQVAYESTWAPGAIAAGGKASTIVAVPGAIVGDHVLLSHDKVLTSALRISGHINAAGIVRVVIQNPTAASVTVASGTLKVLVFKFGLEPPTWYTDQWVCDSGVQVIYRGYVTNPTDPEVTGFYYHLEGGPPDLSAEQYAAIDGSGVTVLQVTSTSLPFPDGLVYTWIVQSAGALGMRSHPLSQAGQASPTGGACFT